MRHHLWPVVLALTLAAGLAALGAYALYQTRLGDMRQMPMGLVVGTPTALPNQDVRGGQLFSEVDDGVSVYCVASGAARTLPPLVLALAPTAPPGAAYTTASYGPSGPSGGYSP